MRMPCLLVTSAVLLALVVGCASGARDEAPTSIQAVPTTATTSRAPVVTSTTSTSTASRPPGAGTPIAEVIRWIEAGTPADPAGFHTVTRDGTTTRLEGGVAFVTPGSEANCVTNRFLGGALSCLIKLTDPPPRPDGIEGVWKGNWVDFTGTGLDVGSAHGDPGPFVDGSGAELAAGQALSFGDYRCRADAAGLFCVNYAHQSAVRMSAAGVEPFGCLAETAAAPGIGRQFSC